jgi:hypothetical protein
MTMSSPAALSVAKALRLGHQAVYGNARLLHQGSVAERELSPGNFSADANTR